MYGPTLDRPSVGGDAHIAPHTAQRCHSEPVLTLAWESVTPRPQARKTPPPSVREVSRLRRDGGREKGGGRMWASAPTHCLPSVHPVLFLSFRGAKRRGNPFSFLPPAASFLSAAKEKRKRNAAKNCVFGFPCAASHGFCFVCFCHTNAVPCKFHLNVALSLLLFSLPLLL